MSFPLPYVLVLLNLSRRPALLPGKDPRRVIVSRRLSSTCLPRVLSPFFCPPRLSTRLAGRFGDERRLLAIAMAMLMSSDAMRISLGCVLLGSLCFPSAYRPASSTRMAGRGTSEPSLLASFGFLLRCADFVDRVIAVAMAASP